MRYLGFTDSTGRYTLEHAPRGTFLLRGLVDQNRNRLLDPRELYDTMTVTVGASPGDTAQRSLHAISRDTIGPGIDRVEVLDSVTLASGLIARWIPRS